MGNFERTAFFRILCLVGMLYQIVDVTRKFMEFKVTVDIELIKNSEYRYPTITVCVDMNDIVNKTLLTREDVNVSDSKMIENFLFKLPPVEREAFFPIQKMLFNCTYPIK